MLKERKNIKEVLSLFKNCNFEIAKIEDYLVDISYGQKDWTMVSALREILANMLDTKSEYVYSYENGVATISDKGGGLPRKAFVIGASTKSDDNTSIGQYGEGLKMALITSLRYNRGVSIKTIGYGVEITSVFSEEYNTEIMRLIFNNNKTEVGTTIKMECSKEEWEDALDLFLQFKEGYQKLDNNLFLPGGYISILGLKTEEKPNMLFSYDLNDKTITNRDRNTVKSKKLKENMEKILNGLKNQKSIKTYFSSLETFPESEEYKIALDPKYKDIWKSVILKMYNDKVAYSTTIESDIKATANGYKVIRCFTKAIQKTLSNLDIKSSKEVSKGVKNDVSIIDKDKITYPISKNYVDSWSYLDAGREFLSNAVDSASSENKATIEFKDGYCFITDDGEGIAKKNFVIGNSQKSDSDIGMFGEGLKLASLVMAREDRDMSIETIEYTYYPILEESKDFGTEIFSIKFEKNKKKNGTIIKFKASEEEVSQIKDLFINYKSDIEKISFDNMEVILNEQNNIYVNGLKSATIDSIFSYNVKDKQLVNTRDRNHINENRLSEILIKFFNSTENEDIIKAFLTRWKENSYLNEYKLIVFPKNLELWKKIVLDIYKNACLVSYDMESNFIAKKAGFEILSDVPPYVKEILAFCIPTTTQIADEYREKGILIGNKIIFPITEDYASSWSKVDAINELISNALDTETEIDLKCEDDLITIEDTGLGFEKKNLLFGVSNSQSVGKAIGNFGEGLKMASLVLSKYKSNVKIETVGFTVEAKIEKDREFDANVLVFDISENTREIGTKITFKGSKNELESSKSMFLKFNNKFEKVIEDEEIYSPGGTLFINGVHIMNVCSKYSYNIVGSSGKSLLNRDRKNIDLQNAFSHISTMIGETNSLNVIEDMLKLNKYSAYENELASWTFKIKGHKKRKWKKVMNEVYDNCCLPVSNSEINLVAKDKGFKVLVDIADLTKVLLQHLDFPKANQVVSLRGDEDVARNVIEEADLTTSEKEKWDMVKLIVSNEYGKEMLENIKVCEEFVNPEEGETHGMYHSGYDKCYILRKLLSDKYSIGYLLGVIMHEITHKETGYHDRTRDFENALTNMIGDLFNRLYEKI